MTQKNTKTVMPDKIEYATLDDFALDGKNPRLGRSANKKSLSQEKLLEIMSNWTLDELATSFVESGFWPQEALIIVREPVNRVEKLVVIEGNRRLAALKYLERSKRNPQAPKSWRDLANRSHKSLLTRIPYIEMPDRDSAKSYLGYRHVTGIKEWKPAEKAQFIAEMIDKYDLTYEDVRRKIGSKTPAVRQNYISYRLLLQMEHDSANVDVEKVEERFSVLYLSLRSDGVRQYLDVDILSDPDRAKTPVPAARMKELENFARWLFGDSKHEPLLRDSRDIDAFGSMLLSRKTLDYLERTQTPSFEVARRMAGVDESEVALHIETAADEAEEALRAAHMHKASERIADAVERLGLHAIQLAKLFPETFEKIKKEAF